MLLYMSHSVHVAEQAHSDRDGRSETRLQSIDTSDIGVNMKLVHINRYSLTIGILESWQAMQSNCQFESGSLEVQRRVVGNCFCWWLSQFSTL